MWRQGALLLLTALAFIVAVVAGWSATVSWSRARLSAALWTDAEIHYQAAGEHWRAGGQTADEAGVTARVARDELVVAIATAEEAALAYRVAATIVQAAFAYDIATSGAVGRGIASCQAVSTASHRRALTRAGVALSGKDIDHIVPRSLGGADHPMNYQVLDASLNRSLGATWGPGKCLGAGLLQCVSAIAVSGQCGAFTVL